jgi:small redox-active disulfide protein 2
MEISSDRRKIMKKIQVLGMGCPKCTKLAENAELAAQQMGIEYDLEKIKDLNVITGFGVMITPAIVIDGDVKASGKVPSVEDIKKMLE